MTIKKVKKRSGKVEKFSKKKLLKSIHISMHRIGIDDKRLEEKITDGVIKKLGKKRIIDTENIRSAVCSVLRKNKHHNVCDFYSLVWLHAKPVKIRNVIKRSGRKEKFSPEKLFKSIQKSFKSSHIHDGLLLESVTREIIYKLGRRYKGKEVPTEDIRNFTEYVLIKRKLNNVAKHYIMHRYM